MLRQNYENIMESVEKAAIKSGRSLKDIEVVFVTKTVEASRIIKAADLGATHIGENRVQELLSKYDTLSERGLKISLIGHLQTNKINYIIDKVDLIQSVDSIRLAKEINRRAEAKNIVMPALMQINIAKEESKHGFFAEEIDSALYELKDLKNLKISGIMSIPPISTNETDARKYFSKLNKIFIDIRGKKMDNIYMDILSMGMSNDYVHAIAEGSNMVRIGSALFGKR